MSTKKIWNYKVFKCWFLPTQKQGICQLLKQTISLAKKDPIYFYKYNLNSTGGEKENNVQMQNTQSIEIGGWAQTFSLFSYKTFLLEDFFLFLTL